ncbi:DEAD/DEAH box helicase, partial [Arthrobacter sp. IA7]|nr:DEAD/DEAH box helicase [Arthrobacter ipis]
GGQRTGRPATGQRAAAGAKTGGNGPVWSSTTGGTSGGSYSGGSSSGGSGRSGDGRPARKAPRRASAPASNERRGR